MKLYWKKTPYPLRLFDSLLLGGVGLYAFFVIRSASFSLEHLPNVIGLKRIYLPPQKSGKVRILDRRSVQLSHEILQRFPSSLRSPSSSHSPSPLISSSLSIRPSSSSISSWVDFLKDQNYTIKSSKGVGTASQVSLIWPSSLPYEDDFRTLVPLITHTPPYLVIGHYQEQRIWIHPQVGVLLSPLPHSWKHMPSIGIHHVHAQWW